jgi:hypothetical protein
VLRPGDHVAFPAADGQEVKGEVVWLRHAGPGRLVIGVRDETGIVTVAIEPDTALGLAVITPPTPLSAAIRLAGQIVAGANPRVPVSLQLRMLAQAVLGLAPDHAP